MVALLDGSLRISLDRGHNCDLESESNSSLIFVLFFRYDMM